MRITSKGQVAIPAWRYKKNEPLDSSEVLHGEI